MPGGPRLPSWRMTNWCRACSTTQTPASGKTLDLDGPIQKDDFKSTGPFGSFAATPFGPRVRGLPGVDVRGQGKHLTAQGARGQRYWRTGREPQVRFLDPVLRSHLMNLSDRGTADPLSLSRFPQNGGPFFADHVPGALSRCFPLAPTCACPFAKKGVALLAGSRRQS